MPALTRFDPEETRTGHARGVVLMLHGGTQVSHEPVDERRSASYRRAAWMARTIAPTVAAAGHALWLLRFGERGWNDPRSPSPVPDARWALERMREEHGRAPVVLLGHSMGARTAVRVADDPSVRGVVGLAPWFQPDDPVRQLAGVRLVAGHGRRDHITRASMTRAYLDRAQREGAETTFHDLGWVGHYMLRRVERWNRFAAREALTLLGTEADCDRA